MREYGLRAFLGCVVMLAGVGCSQKAQAPASTGETVGATAEQPAGATTGSAAAPTPNKAEAKRIVTLGGALTEAVFALGQGDRVVGVDASSTWPEASTKKLPRVGYYRKISAEGVLALKPDEVWATEGTGPEAAVRQLKAAGVTVRIAPAAEDLDGARARVKLVGQWLGEEAKAAEVLGGMDAALQKAKARAAAAKNRPKVLFLYARGPNVLMVAGQKTSADAMLTLAGAENAVTGYEGFKPLSAEAAVAAAPDVVVAPAKGAASIGGAEGVFKLPGLAATPAARDKKLVLVDDLKLLGFGPRVGEGVLELQDGLGLSEAR